MLIIGGDVLMIGGDELIIVGEVRLGRPDMDIIDGEVFTRSRSAEGTPERVRA